MVYLAEKSGDGPQTLKAIAEIGLPDHYLEQLLGSLRRAGLVSTVRGAQGGYHLSRPPDDITVGHIIDAVEGPLHLSGCLGDNDTCPRSNGCRTKRAWENLTDSINNLLNGITLAGMLKDDACSCDIKENVLL